MAGPFIDKGAACVKMAGPVRDQGSAPRTTYILDFQF
nr:hypothetical protein [Tanacetum cinerariifolium]